MRDFGDLFKEYLDDANKENATGTERGLVLVWGAIIDDLTKRVLEAFIADLPDTDDLFKTHGPLSTFSGRVKMCRALALISQEEFNFVEHIRKVRNRFAHELGISFQDRPLAQSCLDQSKNLGITDFPDNPRLAFASTCSTVGVELYKRMLSAEKRKCISPT